MTEPLVIDTEAILAELRAQSQSARGISAEARAYILEYYPQFAELRQCSRFVEIVNQKFGTRLNKSAVQAFYQNNKETRC